ncbi:MAG: hypothetical protein CNLJKLNK_00931 [Holosporales bacterium]
MPYKYKNIYCKLIICFFVFFSSTCFCCQHFFKEWLIENYVDIKKDQANITSENIPDSDLPENPEALENEDPEIYYYQEKPDYVKARHVAYAVLNKLLREKGRNIRMNTINAGWETLGPLSVLMMVYTNGQGVKRNFDLGIFFAALIEIPDGGDRVESIRARKEQNCQDDDFRLKNTITSGAASSYISGLEVKMEKLKIKNIFSDLTRGWNSDEINMFEKLWKQIECYARLRGDCETFTGSARQAICDDAYQSTLYDFIRLLQDMGTKIDHYSLKDITFLDNQLNVVYKKLMSEESVRNLDFGCEKEEIEMMTNKLKQAQRSWIKVRDAFLKFAQKKYPDINNEDIHAALIIRKIYDIQNHGSAWDPSEKTPVCLPNGSIWPAQSTVDAQTK